MSQLRSVLIASLCLLAVPSVKAAEVSFEESPYFETTFIRLNGEITRDDVKKFELLERRFKDKNGKPQYREVRVSLQSGGGDIIAAMQIGRIIRRNDWWTATMIDRDAACASACVLTYVGGVSRREGLRINNKADNLTPLGIHRFFFAQLSPGASRSDITQQYNAAKQTIAAYLTEMNVSLDLLTAMESVPPDEIHFLTVTEAKRLGMSGFDPIYDEQLTARNAAIYGLTSGQYRRLQGVAKAKCGDPLNSKEFRAAYRCEQSILWQLNPKEYDRRAQLMNSARKKPKNDEEGWACMRSIMQGKSTDC